MKLKRLSIALAACLLAFSGVAGLQPVQQPCVFLEASAVDTAAFAEQVALLINQERAANGVAPVQYSETLCQVAQQRAEELVDSFSHDRPDGIPYYSILEGVVTCRCSGENIACGQPDPEAAMYSWMHSALHAQNILEADYQYVGVGVCQDAGVFYWVQIFTGGCALADAYIPTAETASLLGDVNRDTVIDAGDASEILIAAAHMGLGDAITLTTMQQMATDVNQDGQTDAYDAALVLSYTAASGLGNTESISEFVRKVV